MWNINETGILTVLKLSRFVAPTEVTHVRKPPLLSVDKIKKFFYFINGIDQKILSVFILPRKKIPA